MTLPETNDVCEDCGACVMTPHAETCPRMQNRVGFTAGPTSLADIIENHRAVCTASADQISDLMSQIHRWNMSVVYDPLADMITDARQQLENAKETTRLFSVSCSSRFTEERVKNVEAIWRRQNPGFSAALKAIDGD